MFASPIREKSRERVQGGKPSIVPMINLTKEDEQVKHSEPLECFEGKYLDNDYNILWDPTDPSVFYMYNPETIIKIGLISDKEKAESLYIQKRYEEALTYCENDYAMKLKIKAAQINQALCNRHYDKVKILLTHHMDTDPTRWTVWFGKLM